MKKGFTFIELMIVVVIIATLAAIAIPSFLKSREESRKARANQPTTVTPIEIVNSSQYGEVGRFHKVKFDGHTYIVWKDGSGNGNFRHDIDCPCRNKVPLEKGETK